MALCIFSYVSAMMEVCHDYGLIYFIDQIVGGIGQTNEEKEIVSNSSVSIGDIVPIGHDPLTIFSIFMTTNVIEQCLVFETFLMCRVREERDRGLDLASTFHFIIGCPSLMRNVICCFSLM